MKHLTIAASALALTCTFSGGAFAQTLPQVMMMQADFGSMARRDVTGRNLIAVKFATGKAALVETSKGVWQEYNSDGEAIFRFREERRDDWSVYLVDESRNTRLQIDIHRKMVRVSQGGEAMADYRPIRTAYKEATVTGMDLRAMTTDGSNGRNLTAVQIIGGQAGLIQTSPGVWREYDRMGEPTFEFRETGRDDWSVFLTDAGRGISLQIDVHRKMVSISENGGAMADYKKIGRAFKSR